MPASRGRTYTVEEGRALVPLLRSLLLQLAVEQGRLNAAHAALHTHLRGNGNPDHAAETTRHERTVAGIRDGMNALVGHFDALEVVLRDLDNGLCDILPHIAIASEVASSGVGGPRRSISGCA